MKMQIHVYTCVAVRCSEYTCAPQEIVDALACVCCSVLKCVTCDAVCCSVLQCVVVCCVLQCVAVRCSTHMDITSGDSWCPCLRALQCVAVCCSVSQRSAARCSDLQCEEVHTWISPKKIVGTLACVDSKRGMQREDQRW